MQTAPSAATTARSRMIQVCAGSRKGALTMAKKKEMDKLAYENHLALAAGMSYGKWKAMQNPVKIEPKKLPIGIETKKCPWCGVEFFSGDHKTKYCSKRCKQLARNDRMVQKYREKVTKATDDP